MNRFLYSWLLLICVLFQPTDALAQYYSNGSEQPVLVVDKKIKLPNRDKLLDNISKSDYLFKEGDQIEFAITVENRGSVAIYDLSLVDKLPSFLQLQYFFGNPSKDKTNLETTISVLNPGEIKRYFVIALIKDLPISSYSQTLKQTNTVCANSTLTSDCDKATYFAGSQTMPVTGSSNVLLLNTVLLNSVFAGAVLLRRLVRGY